MKWALSAIFLVLSLTCLPLAARESGQENPPGHMNPDTGLGASRLLAGRSLQVAGDVHHLTASLPRHGLLRGSGLHIELSQVNGAERKVLVSPEIKNYIFQILDGDPLGVIM